MFSPKEAYPVTRQLDSYSLNFYSYSPPDRRQAELKSNLEDLLMKFITTQMATNELLKESQMRQDETMNNCGGKFRG